jgi:hypothetical protein
MFNRKRVSNDALLKDPVLSGNLIPESDNTWSLGSAQKRLKTGFFNALNVVSAITTFVTLSLSGTLNQITMGTGTTTTVNAPSPGQNQIITVPDSGTGSSQFILANSSTSQTINTGLTLSGTFQCAGQLQLTSGMLRVLPTNGLATLALTGLGGNTNAAALSIQNLSLIGSSTVAASSLPDDQNGDTILLNSSDSGFVPNAAIRIGFSGSNSLVRLVPMSITPTSNQLVLGGNGRSNAITISAASPGSSRTYGIIDTGSNSNFVMTSGSQSILGVKTFTTLNANATTNQLVLANSTINCPSTGPRTFSVPDSYQSCNILTNSIICGFGNTQVRPAITGGTTPQAYEIRAFSSSSLGNDDGFLRLRAGGGTNGPSATWIDISGASTIGDMSRNIGWF